MCVAARSTGSIDLSQVSWCSPHPSQQSTLELVALKALRAETMRVSATTAAATSIAVHLTRVGEAAASQFSTALMRPGFSDGAASHVETLTAAGDRAELARAWTLVQTELVAANQLSAAHCRGDVTVRAVREAWQRASRTLLEWFALLQPLMLERGAVVDTAHDAPTLALLRRAAAGVTPSLDASGPFALPACGERRGEPRHHVSVAVTLTVGTRCFGAHLANISTRGLLILAERHIPAGRRIVVTLRDGRTLEGTVCWSNVRQIGVALEVPVALDDELWSEVGRHAATAWSRPS